MQEVGARDVIVVSTSAHVALASLLGQPASLQVSLADGSRTPFSGDISEAAMLGSEGGLARYRLRLTPWLWRLSQVRNSRVWQDKSVIEHRRRGLRRRMRRCALWRWSDETAPFMQEAGRRSYCCQYRESDYDFVQRLLTEEGLAWRFEQVEDGMARAVCRQQPGERHARGRQQRGQAAASASMARASASRGDSVQALAARGAACRCGADHACSAMTTRPSRPSPPACRPTRLLGGKHAPVLESYDTPGQYCVRQRRPGAALRAIADAGARSARQLWRGALDRAHPARRHAFHPDAGAAAARAMAPHPRMSCCACASVGVNNLPSPAQQALAELFGPIPELLEETVAQLGRTASRRSPAIAQAQASGYANCFEAITAGTPWRPLLDGNDARQHATPTALRQPERHRRRRRWPGRGQRRR